VTRTLRSDWATFLPPPSPSTAGVVSSVNEALSLSSHQDSTLQPATRSSTGHKAGARHYVSDIPVGTCNPRSGGPSGSAHPTVPIGLRHIRHLRHALRGHHLRARDRIARPGRPGDRRGLRKPGPDWGTPRWLSVLPCSGPAGLHRQDPRIRQLVRVVGCHDRAYRPLPTLRPGRIGR